MSLRISAAICTHNRASSLPGAIDSLLQQNLPPSEYEILVIDNCSTDETPAILRRYVAAARSVSLRSARAEPLGLSHARNLAVRLADGQIIAFIDDDAIASTQWLASLLDAYIAYPDAGAVGGKVLPRWECERPDWLTDDLLPQLSMLDLGDIVRRLSGREELHGVNCSFRHCLFPEIGDFRADLGRRGDSLLGSEESELQKRILRRGKSLVYTPRAVVYHLVTAERLQPRYFVRLAYGKGRTRARLMMADPSHGGGMLRYALRGGFGVARQWLLLGWRILDRRKRLQSVRVTAHWFGFAHEVVRQSICEDS